VNPGHRLTDAALKYPVPSRSFSRKVMLARVGGMVVGYPVPALVWQPWQTELLSVTVTVPILFVFVAGAYNPRRLAAVDPWLSWQSPQDRVSPAASNAVPGCTAQCERTLSATALFISGFTRMTV
jgi:hypothetical protein